MLPDLTNDIMLEKLNQAKAKARLKQSNWPDKYLIGGDDKPVPFHRAQELTWDSPRRIVAYISGSQGGKTAVAPWWLKREIGNLGGGDYLAVTASFDLFKLKFLPQMLRVFVDILGWGRFWAGDKIIELKDPAIGEYWATKSTDTMWGRIILRSAQALGGLESATAKAALLDEAGQDEFPPQAYQAIRRRLALYKGRMFISTTLYNLGWVKSTIIDVAEKHGTKKNFYTDSGGEIEVTDSEKDDICVVQADSIVNPAFPMDEYEEAKATLPQDVFAMFYRGRVAKPRHLIYDCFDDDINRQPRFELPAMWQRYMGLDFGLINMAATFWAEEPKSRKLYCYRVYLAGSRSTKDHVDAMLEGEPMLPICFGGAKAEGQWRKEFRDAGLSVREPKVSDVWLGINIVYGEIKAGNLIVFDDLDEFFKEIYGYRRKYDESGNPTDEIYSKNAYHLCDTTRYLIASVRSHRKALVATA